MAQNQKGRNPASRDIQRKKTNDPNRPDSNQKNMEEQENKEQKGSKYTAKREDTLTEGYGSSQKREDKNVGPMDAELDDLPSESRTNRESGSTAGI